MEEETPINPTPTQNKSFYVYLLSSHNNRQTYVGATVDLEHRLRQHNGEIKGGAKATSRQLHKGEWQRIAYVSQFPTWQAALQFEWRWKQLTRKQHHKTPPIHRRLTALHHLVDKLERSTSKAIPYREWPTPPQIHFANNEISHLYQNIKLTN